MIDTTCLDAAATLAAAVQRRAAADRAEADLLAVAAHWADLHAVLPGEAAGAGRSTVDGSERMLPLAGDGAPDVAEFAPAELGAAMRMSTHAAGRLVGDSLELRHRLPRLWARVHAGVLQAWRARQIADHTRLLSPEAAAFVDAHLAPVAHKIGLGRVLGLVEVALRRFDPAAAAQRERDAADGRGVWVSDTSFDGTRSITIQADALDATHFDQALDDVATALAALGDGDTKHVRRARAVGILADPKEALDLLTEETTAAATAGETEDFGRTEAATTDPARPRRQHARRDDRRKATLYVHLSSAAVASTSGTARVEDLGPASLDLVARWLGRHDVTLRPVIDLDDRTAVDAYETPQHIRETVLLRSPCCPFPWCDNLSRHKDMDHITPYVSLDDGGPPGQTAAHLLGPPCRRHHRLKTHTGWTCTMPEPGIYLWRSPHGRRYLVDHTGTQALAGPRGHRLDPTGSAPPAGCADQLTPLADPSWGALPERSARGRRQVGGRVRGRVCSRLSAAGARMRIMTRWSLQAIQRAAPDAASLAAGRRLATPGPWSESGSTDQLVWGRCQGSGPTPYQVSIDLSGPAYRCTCPSRKLPCKHALALLLLWVRGDGSVAEGEPGADDRTWVRARAQSNAAGTAADAADRSRRTGDPEARAKRLAERLRLMHDGSEEFALWLRDLVRGGLVEAKRQPLTWWDTAAARLVDAQLPGLAERVRDLGSEVNRRDDWADHLLAELGRCWTAACAWQRRDELDERARADLRTFVGWPVPTEEVRSGDAVDDHWHVLGAHRSDDGRLQQQRTWLRAVGSGETVLLLDFAARGTPLPAARLVGSVLDATVARYPGSAPRRALFAGEPAVVTTDYPLPAGGTLDDAHAAFAAAWTANPWTNRVPVVLAESALSAGDIRDAAGATVPLLPVEDPWRLAALTGGRPVTVFGELEVGGFRPLALDLDDAGEAR